MLILLLSCTIVPEKSKEEKLAEASTKVIFASVEPLGSHVFQSKVRRKEFREGKEVSSHDEIVEITWQNWDNFQYTRTIDTKEVSSLIVHNHIPWLRSYKKPWKKYDDAEPYRLQLRSAWNTWEQYLGTYEQQLSWRVLETTEREGRPATRYEITLDTNRLTEKKNLGLSSLSGSVLVDTATAARLYTEIEMVLSSDSYKKEINIQLQRSDIGKTLEITPPSSQ